MKLSPSSRRAVILTVWVGLWLMLVPTGQAQQGTLRWELALDNHAVSAPTIGGDGTLYLTSVEKIGSDYWIKLNAVNPDGTLKWTYEPGNYGTWPYFPSVPVIGPGGKIFVWLGGLYEIRPNGTKVWKYSFGTPAIGSNGHLYAINGYWSTNYLQAWEPHRLQPLWEVDAGTSSFHDTSVGADGTIYAGCSNNRLYAINPDGTEKWQHPRELYEPAIGADGALFFGSREDDCVYAIEPGGTYGWKYDLETNPTRPVIGLDNTIIVGAGNGSLYAFETDGSLKTEWYLAAAIYYAAAIGDDGTIYVGTTSSKLYAIDTYGPDSWTYQLNDYSRYPPTIGSDGTVYVASGNELLAINGNSGGPAETPWPQVRHDAASTNRAHRCPLVDLKINGNDTNFSQSSSLPLDITVSLDPGDREDVPFEWWFFAEMDSIDSFWWRWPGSWLLSSQPLSVFGSPFGLVPVSDLLVASGTVPPASWTFHFAVDGANGHYDGTYLDTIKVNVY